MAAALFEGSRNEGETDNLNAIAAEYAALGAFSDCRGIGRRGRTTIGIIGSLSSYGYLPLWHTLFAQLGYSIKTPDLRRLDAFTIQAENTITSENLCIPAKSAHGRIFEMIDRGIDALFAPKYRTASLCTVLCNYSQVIKNNIPAVADGAVGLIDPALDDVKLCHFYGSPERFASVLEAIRSFDTATPPTDREFGEALSQALETQRRFDEDTASLHRKTVEQIFHGEGKRAIVIAARPYQLAADQLKGIDRRFHARGYTVLSPLAIRISLRQMPWAADEDPTRNHDAFLRYVAEGVIDEPTMNVVFLQSAHCAYDALSIAEARRMIVEGGRRCAIIDIDGSPEQIDSQINTALKDFQEERARRNLEASDTLSPSQAIEFLVDSYRDESLRLDAQKQFSDIPDSLCNTVSALFRDSLDSFSDDPDLTEVRLPTVCKGCLVDMLPSLLSRNLDREVTVVWDDHWIEAPEIVGIGHGQLAGFDASGGPSVGPSAAPASAGPKPTLGLAGNALLCFNGPFVAMLGDLIERNGGRLVAPDPANFHPEDGYSEQLEAYGRQGVDGILCLQDTHCLKEHVNLRGSLADLQRRFPTMQLIAVEINEGLSPTALENRVLLALTRISDRHREQQSSASMPQ